MGELRGHDHVVEDVVFSNALGSQVLSNALGLKKVSRYIFLCLKDVFERLESDLACGDLQIETERHSQRQSELIMITK